MREAVDGSFEVAHDSTYGELAPEVNVLMIKYRLGIDASHEDGNEEGGVLVPICPQFTLRRSVTFANDHPMELVSEWVGLVGRGS